MFFISPGIVLGQKTHYVSSSGNDNNDGLSKHTPLKTITKILPGSTYLLKRGDTIYTRISSVSTTPETPIKIAAYGRGPRPIISTYKVVKSSAWRHYGENLWVASISNLKYIEGYLDTTDTNVGFINVNGKLYGHKFKSINELKNNWDFASVDDRLIVFNTINPAKAGVFKLGCQYNIITLSSNMELRNLSLEGSGGHAIKGFHVENVQIHNLTIRDIGGSYLYKDGTTRYGNGIEFWGSAKNCIVRRCSVSQVYDAAFTLQGQSNNMFFERVKFENNYAFNNEQTFEFWILGNKSGFKQCEFKKNISDGIGFGWSHSVRPDKKAAVHILNYHWEVTATDLKISRNIFLSAKSGYMYSHSSLPNSFKSFKNKIVMNLDLPFNTRNPEITIAQTDVVKSELEQDTEFRNVIDKVRKAL
jgi:hypothetical protein